MNRSGTLINDLYRRLRDFLLKWPLTTWVLLGFFLSFFFFFVVPIFFSPLQAMQFRQYILALSPIGHDFRVIVSASSAWFNSGVAPTTLYPPLTLIFFAPFTFLNDDTGFKILTLITLICYVLITLILPQRINKQTSISAITMLVFLTGLVSYGLQFELERGQWNVIAFTFCLAAIYIFHLHPRRRWLAYLLFTIAVQLKIYPAIFILTLVDDWRDWNGNIRRFAGLGLINIAALFIFGASPLWSMARSLVTIEASNVGRPFNLSISSFVLHILSLHSLPHKRIILWLQANGWLPELFLVGCFVVCFVIIILQAYRRGSKGFNPQVFMACSLGALMVPSISFDYKLAFFAASVVLWLPAVLSLKENRNKLFLVLLTLVFSVAYSSTLYPTINKPEWLQYNLPVLFLILIIVTTLPYVESYDIAEPSLTSPEVHSHSQ